MVSDSENNCKALNPVGNKYLTADEVSDMLQISKVTLRAWTSQKKIPYYKVGRSVRFSSAKLQEWLNQQEIKARSK